MLLDKIPTWLRFVLGLSLVVIGGANLRAWYGVIVFVAGIPLLVSARLEVFRKANEAWRHRTAKGGQEPRK